MRENRSRKHTGLCCRVCAILGTVGMAALSASAGEGEVITDKLTAYDESKFYGDVTIKLFDVAPPTNAGILNFNFDTDEGGVVTDQSGNGNTGVVSGAVTSAIACPGSTTARDVWWRSSTRRAAQRCTGTTRTTT